VKYLRDEEGIAKFGFRLKTLRKAKGYTQEALGWKAGIEPMHLSKIERGVVNTSLTHILALARALGIPPAGFFE
jgi:transcriptional regulator with XRE-family HTH domain